MTPAVLLPGMMCDARLWGPVLGAFAGRDVILPALADADSVAGMAEAVIALAPPRFALAGISMGGIVAMEIVARAPGRVERLALLDTNPLAEAPEVRARRRLQVARALSGDLAGVMRDEMKPNYLAPGPGNRAILDLCLDMALGLGSGVFARQSAALAGRSDRTAALAAYDGPALVLMGADDRLCPRARHELMHALLRASRLVIVEGAGHLPGLERPGPTAAALAGWLAM